MRKRTKPRRNNDPAIGEEGRRALPAPISAARRSLHPLPDLTVVIPQIRAACGPSIAIDLEAVREHFAACLREIVRAEFAALLIFTVLYGPRPSRGGLYVLPRSC
jgi:hypothetical protein